MVKFRLTDQQRAQMGQVVRQANESYDDTGLPGVIFCQPNDACTTMQAIFLPPTPAKRVQYALGRPDSWKRVKEPKGMIILDIYDGRDAPSRKGCLAHDMMRFTTVGEGVDHITQSAWDGDDDELYATVYMLRNDAGHVLAIGRFVLPGVMEIDADPVLEWTFMDGRPAVARRKAEVYARLDRLEKETAPEADHASEAA